MMFIVHIGYTVPGNGNHNNSVMFPGAINTTQHSLDEFLELVYPRFREIRDHHVGTASGPMSR